LVDIDTFVGVRRKVKRDQTLFHSGDGFINLYVVQSGFFKTSVATEDGREQVTGFQMAGELLGLDGVANDVHGCDAIALEDAVICVMPFERIEAMCRKLTALQHHLHRNLSREIVRENGVMLMLASMRSEERLAAFLLNLVDRLHARGFSQTELVLRMTRGEIGSYLGLKLETVSRTFSRFADEGIATVRLRHIHILDADALRRMVRQTDLPQPDPRSVWGN
jgi:CRP/FNR family transcriptional regulator